MFSDSEALLRLILRNSELTATPLAAAAAAALMANQAAVSGRSSGSPQPSNPLNALTGLQGLSGHHHMPSLTGHLGPPNSGQLSPNSVMPHDLPIDLHKPSTSTTPPCSSTTGSSTSAVSVTSAAAAASLALQSLSAKFPLLAVRPQSPSASSIQRSARQYTMSAFPGTSTSRVTTAGSEQIQVHRQADGSLAYSCDFCGFMSNNRHTILRHRRTHTGERPYACTLCSYKAIQMWNLEQHIKRRHPHAAPPSG
ncbi:zinc finger protein-like, partial [Tropilaelaps mercedesae]